MMLTHALVPAIDPTSASVFCAYGTSHSDRSHRPNNGKMDYPRRILSCFGSITICASKSATATVRRTTSYFRLPAIFSAEYLQRQHLAKNVRGRYTEVHCVSGRRCKDW